jgi:hypothetical protein
VIELPAAINKQKDDTLSEHVWKWFRIKDNKSRTRRIILGLFLLGLSLHFIFAITVIPVIVFGSIVAYIIGKETGMFRWDQWLKGLAYSVVITLISALGPVISDGSITASEGWMLVTTALGCITAWCKNHPPAQE